MTQVIDVVLPALNEALALPGVLSRLPEGYRAIVVDNGSTDGTADVAIAYGAIVVTERLPGYGAAVHAGLLRADSDTVCVMDADGSFDAADLVPLVRLVADGEADLALGRRRPVSSGCWPWHARLGNRFLGWLLRRRLGISIHDIGPMRVCRREPLLALAITDRRFGYPLETLVRAAQEGWRLVEVDVAYGPRAVGTKSKVTGSLTGTAKAVRDFYKVLG